MTTKRIKIGQINNYGVFNVGEIHGNVTVTNDQLAKLPSEYAEGLKRFTEELNNQFKNHNIRPEQAKLIEDSLSEFVNEVEDIKPNQPVGVIKKTVLKSKFIDFAKGVLTSLPKTAETLVTFTPLAPFNKLIGEGIQQLVEAIQKEL